MAGCGFGPCDDATVNGGPGCHLCDVIAHLPQPARLVAPSDLQKHERADLRDKPTRKDLVFRPRRREGAFRQQRG